MRIVFMGTPDFAVASLKALVESGENVVAVVTNPDKPAGRGQQIQESPVKKYANIHGIPILQPLKFKDPQFIEELASYQADIQVVVAFKMLPEIVWNMPPLGTINVHASLLPQYRGAAPINHAIINGEKETGVTTFLLQHEIDTGNILLKESVGINNNDNAGTLHDKLMNIGADLLIKTISGLKNNSIISIKQNELIEEDLKFAPKIFKQDCRIDWSQNSVNIFNFIRGLSPYPAAFTLMHNKVLKIFEAEIELNNVNLQPGEFTSDEKNYLKFACNDGLINLKTVQIEGKKKMKTDEFLRGYHFPSK